MLKHHPSAMKDEQGNIRLSASDLTNHLACRHLTAIDLAVARGQRASARWKNPDTWVLQQRGMEHEQNYVEHLRASGLSIVNLREVGSDQRAVEETLAAMKSGAQVITQATMRTGRWLGRADILRRVDRPSYLGLWSYEVYDCKLARETKAETVLQLSLYSDLLQEIQGVLPERMYVVHPGVEFIPEAYRVLEFSAYYRQVKTKLEQAVDLDGNGTTYPEPNPHCDVCPWWRECDTRWRNDDHLSLVAGITRLQRKQLVAWEAPTVEKLARLALPLPARPKYGSPEGLIRVREQARVQVASRHQGPPVVELLEGVPGQGLMQLPEPDSGDIFFDIEGDPFVGSRGLEYLFGLVTADAAGQPAYVRRWAISPQEERDAFEWSIDTVMEAWSRQPAMHVYHFTPYEPAAIKRLMGRYATREDEVDRMLRASLFVDLHGITRHAARIGVEEYSLKGLEHVHGFTREVPLREAAFAKRTVEQGLELSHSMESYATSMSALEGYNREDCLSTLSLRAWLEQQRTSVIAAGGQAPRPQIQQGTPPAAVDERQQRVAALFARLTEGVPVEPEKRSEEEYARWLLAALLDWHRREEKAEWWEFFRLRELSDDDLLDEKSAIAGLQWVERIAVERSLPVDRYRFAPQETGIRQGDTLRHREDTIGSVQAIDPIARTLDIKKTKKAAEIHPGAVFAFSTVNSRELAESVFRLGAWVQEHGIDAPGPYRAARDLLLRKRPRTVAPAGEALVHPGETMLDAARRIALSIDFSVLPIQGPPGAGKTYTGARMICELLRQGKKVGITALSHKVIRNLLDEVVKAAQEANMPPMRCVQKVTDRSGTLSDSIHETTDNAEALQALQSSGGQIVAGTGWLWSRQDFFEAADVLFVDEAGQMSVANVLAVAQAAKSVVLLGDPRQLDQPLKGSHPEGADLSALEYLLAGEKTITPDRGLFLENTYRLHPAICAFTSEVFYEGRLQSRPGLEQQRVEGHPWLGRHGLWFLPVEHQGNQNSALEEVDRIVELVDSLLQPQVFWIDHQGHRRGLTIGDILIVAPYNAQVFDLAARIPGANIGTVDRFQGQEAPVVIYSLTTSSPEEAPRGMEFLYSLNRLNVATSRARALAILLGSPRLLEPECRSPRQMQLANALCRYMEIARVPVRVEEQTIVSNGGLTASA
ncbi:MAG TPA: TM0106 family RecB-like putative nuclease [Candidatus Saccharimonadales bacterium]|jgi:predicted RecB family nuclease|nr:TM0106 family RecB-like putative nuclease [Candidatus Saccharimonadales bacterium]